MNFTFSGSTNRITTSGYSYDAAGDLIGDGTNTYQWDAEGRLVKALNGGGTAISTNTYNALGQRVRDVTSSAITDEAYGADGSLLWRYTGNSSTNRSFVPLGGGLLAEYYSGGTLFDHPDELGSVAASTAYNGGACQERLFYPYGELWTGAGNCGMHQEFAKLPDYDAETDQYDTLARHYTPMGRWMSPDPVVMSPERLLDPQQLNRYAYVRNNPTTLTDPTGALLTYFSNEKAAYGSLCSIVGNDCGGPTEYASNDAASSSSPEEQVALKQAQQQLSQKSENAILNSNLTGPQAIAFEDAVVCAGGKYGIDPNTLVGLANQESSLSPDQVNGSAKGLFQITPGRQKDLGLSDADLGDIGKVVNAVAGALGAATKTFNGNSDLAIASWTLGATGTQRLFSSGGMQSVRNALLSKSHPEYGRVGPDYIDKIKSFGTQ